MEKNKARKGDKEWQEIVWHGMTSPRRWLEQRLEWNDRESQRRSESIVAERSSVKSPRKEYAWCVWEVTGRSVWLEQKGEAGDEVKKDHGCQSGGFWALRNVFILRTIEDCWRVGNWVTDVCFKEPFTCLWRNLTWTGKRGEKTTGEELSHQLLLIHAGQVLGKYSQAPDPFIPTFSACGGSVGFGNGGFLGNCWPLKINILIHTFAVGDRGLSLFMCLLHLIANRMECIAQVVTQAGIIVTGFQ